MHVFADLRPYICTFSDCKDKLVQFTTRAVWAHHEFTEHRVDRTWKCSECSEKLGSASDWQQHLQKTHQRIFTEPQLCLARNNAHETHPRHAESEECPLCRSIVGKPRRAFVKHIGRHMEEIALLTLPRSIGEDSDESSVNTDPLSLGSEGAKVTAGQIEFDARKEMSHDQNDNHSKNHTTKQDEFAAQVIETDRLSWDNFEEVPRCICGVQEYPGLSGLPGNLVKEDPKGVDLIKDSALIQCDSCRIWQHRGCVGIGGEATRLEAYFCELCRKDLHQITTTANGYLFLRLFARTLLTRCVVGDDILCTFRSKIWRKRPRNRRKTLIQYLITKAQCT